MGEFTEQDHAEVLDLLKAFAKAIQNKYGDEVNAFNALFALAAMADELVRSAPPEYRRELLEIWDRASAIVKQENPTSNH